MHDWRDDIFDALVHAGIRQVALVPDAGHSRLIERCRAEPAMRCITLTTEAEGPPLLAGAWLGGQRGVLLMQSSGVGNCPNMLATVETCRFPLLMLVTMRGEAGEFNPWQVPMGRTAQALLELYGTRVYRLERPGDAAVQVLAAAGEAFADQVPVAVLIAQDLIGTKSFGK